MIMDQVAVVTGSSRGIGRAIALDLAREGYSIVINYKENEESAKEVLEKIKREDGKAITVKADVSDPEEAKLLIARAVEEFGGLDVLVNNAGITNDQLIVKMTDEDWDQIIKTNLNSAFYCCRAALKHMVKGHFGRIINISSVAALVGNKGQTNYAASKSGLLGLTFSIAREYGSRGITANVVAPGLISSDMTFEIPPEQIKDMLKGVAAKRMGTALEVAAAVSFLASPAASYVNAQVLRVDGGMGSL